MTFATRARARILSRAEVCPRPEPGWRKAPLGRGRPEGAGCGGSKRGPKYAKRILGLNQCAAWVQCSQGAPRRGGVWRIEAGPEIREARSEEHTSELQSLMRISYAVFCLKKKKKIKQCNTKQNTITEKQTLQHSKYH